MPLPVIDTKKFKHICTDWIKMFPEYQIYRKGIFSKIVGPFEFSIYLDLPNDKQKYRIFSCLSPFLIKADSQNGMAIYLETQVFGNGLIGWQGHTKLGLPEKGAQSLRDTTPFPLEGPVKVSQILEAYDQRQKKGGIYLEDMEAPALLCGWAGRPELAPRWIEWGRQKYLDRCQLVPHLKEKYIDRFGNLTGFLFDEYSSIEEWMEDMHKRVQDTDYLRNLTEEQIKQFNYTKIPRYDLIIDI